MKRHPLYAAFLAAALAAAAASGGGTVFFPRGQYFLTRAILVPPSTVFAGERMDLVALYFSEATNSTAPPDWSLPRTMKVDSMRCYMKEGPRTRSPHCPKRIYARLRDSPCGPSPAKTSRVTASPTTAHGQSKERAPICPSPTRARCAPTQPVCLCAAATNWLRCHRTSPPRSSV